MTRRLILGVLVVLCGFAAAVGSASASVLAGAVPDGVPHHHTPLAHTAAGLPWNGGAVLHHNRTHLVFWDPAGAGVGFDPGYAALFQRFLAGVAHDSHQTTNVYSVTGQYTDESGAAAYNSTYAGAIADTDPLPPHDLLCRESPEGPAWGNCVTDDQIQAELTHVVAALRLPVTLGDIYFLITPSGLADCDTSTLPASCSLGGPDFNGYCAYHSSTGSDLLYAVVPYNAVPNHCGSDGPRPNGSTADPGLSSLSHEHNETITDPLGSGWIDGSGSEDGDLCIDTAAHPPAALGQTPSGRYDQVIGGGRYWLQSEWSNVDGGCVTHAGSDHLSLGLPRTISAGAGALLVGRGSAPHGRLVGIRWYFGDRGTATGFRVRHTYRRPGHYTVVARGVDSFGNWVFARHAVTVRARR